MRCKKKNAKNEYGTVSDAHFVEGKALLQNAVDRADVERLYEARERFERALEINPHNAWVEHVLMPKLDQEVKE